MRFHNPFDDILGNPVKLRALRVLSRAPAQGFTGRELAGDCDTSPSQMILALQSLEESGVVTRQVIGPSHVWRLSTSHLLSEQLVRLFEQERLALPVLKAELRSVVAGMPIRRAILFGSVARSEERPTSDVDLFVQVRSVDDKIRIEEVLSSASPKFALKFGNPLSSLVLTDAQIRERTNPPLVNNILNEGQEVAP
jgi:predicted nucleotidyltransferase